MARTHGTISVHGTFYTATEVYTLQGFVRFREDFVGYTTNKNGKPMVARA
jgi:hypothetical protein